MWFSPTVTIDHVGLLLHKLRGVQYEVMQFGIKLGLKINDIEAVCIRPIKMKRNCQVNMFFSWLKLPSQHRTWKILVHALKRGSEQEIADTIERRYILRLDEPGMTDILIIVQVY